MPGEPELEHGGQHQGPGACDRKGDSIGRRDCVGHEQAELRTSAQGEHEPSKASLRLQAADALYRRTTPNDSLVWRAAPMNQAWVRFLPSFVRTRLDGRFNLQRILANIGWLSADRVLRMGMGLVVGVWVARYLGPRQFGLLNFTVAFVALFGPLAALGLDSIVVRDIVRNPSNKNEILGTTFASKLTGGIIAFLLCVAIAFIIRPSDRLTHWLVGIIAAGMIFQPFDTIDLWFQSQIQSKYTVLAKNSAFLLIALVRIVLILTRAPLIAFAWAGLTEVALGALALIIFHRVNALRLLSWRVSFSRAKDLLRDSWPLILAGVAIMVYMKIDQVMLGMIVSDEEVGIYSAAVRVSEVWYFIPIVVSSSINPTFIRLYNESEELFYDKLKQVMGYFFWGTLCLSVAITIFSDKVINVLYGSDYAQAAGVLSIHIYSGIITSMGVVFSQKFVLDGTTRISFYGAVAGAVSNVILNLWLIGSYGAYGAAISTVISYAMPVVFLSTVFDRKIGLVFLDSIVYFLRRKIG